MIRKKIIILVTVVVGVVIICLTTSEFFKKAETHKNNIPPTEAEKVRVEFYDGELISRKNVNSGENYKTEDFPEVERNGYRFIGWFSKIVDGKQTRIGDEIGDNNGASNIKYYARWEKTTKGVDETERGLPVLMYHFFCDPEHNYKCKRGADTKFELEMKDVNKQLEYLHNQKYYYPSWAEVYAYLNGEIRLPKKSVVVTTDDAVPSFFDLMVPAEVKYKVYGTSFVITDVPHSMEKEENGLYAGFIDYELHTDQMHHMSKHVSDMQTWSYSNILADLKKNIEKIGGNHWALAYPFGRRSPQAIQAVKDAGIKMAFTTDRGRVYPGMDHFQLPRVPVYNPTTIEQFKDMVK